MSYLGEVIADIALDNLSELVSDTCAKYGVKEILEKKNTFSEFMEEIRIGVDTELKRILMGLGVSDADPKAEAVLSVLDPFIRDEKPAQFGEKVNQQLTCEQETDVNDMDGRTQVTLRASIPELVNIVKSSLR